MDLSYVIPVVCRRWYSVSCFAEHWRSFDTDVLCSGRTTPKSSSVLVLSTWALGVCGSTLSWSRGQVSHTAHRSQFRLLTLRTGSIRMYHPGVPHNPTDYREQLQLLVRHHYRCHGPLWCLVRARRTSSLPRTQAQLGRDTRTSHREQHAPPH